jgi:RHO1 GDP-GTP exchange protein 1/2
MFLDDMDGGSDARMGDLEELPSGVILLMTKCYSPGCSDEDPCYAYACPRKVCWYSERRGSRLTLATEGHAVAGAHALGHRTGASRNCETSLSLSCASCLPCMQGAQVAPEWKKTVDPSVLRSLPDSEINRQSIIHNVINKEIKYVQDLDIVQSVVPIFLPSRVPYLHSGPALHHPPPASQPTRHRAGRARVVHR